MNIPCWLDLKNITLKLGPIVAILLTTATFSLAAETPSHRVLKAVPFTEVHFQDTFWMPRLVTNHETSLPHNFEWCENTGRISNFAKAGKLEQGKFKGLCFNDSDVYKVLEGASYSLATSPDPALEKTVDEVIAKIASAQQPDGYLNTYFTLTGPDKRWSNLGTMHELYCAGHLVEAAVAHYRATGKRTLLDVALKFVDYIDSVFGPTKRRGLPGHEELELALVKLYQLTGQQKYLDLAEFFIDMRGNGEQRGAGTWGIHCQDHEPVRKQSEITGHAVRAMYLYAGATDIAAYTGDKELINAMSRLWRDVTQRKMYITGGIGAVRVREAFGTAYELPNSTAYCETCAAIGLALWAHRLNLMHGDAQYADAMERVLYNGILSGVGMDGKHFFYVNPLASDGSHHRQPFFDCACCPSNSVRFLPSLPGYVYATSDQGIFVNLYVAGNGKVSWGDGTIRLTQETKYPWEGRVKITVEPSKPGSFAMNFRVPAWCDNTTVSVNGKPVGPLDLRKGYARIHRHWEAGDVVQLELPMPVERIEANPRVQDDRGCVAIQRGPIIFCFESVDNTMPVKDIVLAADPKFTTQYREDLLGGVMVVMAEASNGEKITAVPYFAWDHRQPGAMGVWVPQEGKLATPDQNDPSWKNVLYRRYKPGNGN